MKNNKIAKNIIKSVSIYLLGIAFLIPIFWVFSLSLRSKKDALSAMFFTKDLHFENYVKAWQTFGFSKLYLNSLIVTVLSVFITLVISALAAYSFSRLRYKGSNIIFYMLLLGMMIPPAAVIIPLFVIMENLKLYNTLFSLIFSYIAFGLPIATLILRGFFMSIPPELVEAARIDGSSEIGTFFRIIIPLSKPAISTVVIFLFMQNWNEFLLGLVLLKDKILYTLPVGVAIFVGQWDSPWELVASGVIIASVPIFILYLILQDQFVKGLTAGAVKG
ncbi:MAG: carbohydrate ABC transporter permease [Actinobacteria bacterium]|nr:carbohydrate ABC transporter permease [Actinomycetota bacterium]